MIKKRSIEEIQNLEKAISDKYGQDSIKDPRSEWNEEKEREYQRQLIEAAQRERSSGRSEKVDNDGFLVIRKLVNAVGIERQCPVCQSYTFTIKDDVCLKKFECCSACYVQYVEDREERWQNGWRPKNVSRKDRFDYKDIGTDEA